VRKTLETCRICASATHEIFKARILSKYNVAYYHCATCGFLQTEEPYWLDEAYHTSITTSDTGGLLRNLALAETCSVLIYFLFDKYARYLDFAGGYGIFTRRMRDIGFDFYWDDRYSTNLLARGFEYTEELGKVEAVTTFESFEHFSNPLKEIETMFLFSKNIIFTTDLLPSPVPKPEEWYYYGLHHGQHISFYSNRTLEFIASKYNLNYYSIGSLHFFTEKKIEPALIKLFLKLKKIGLFLFVKKNMISRTTGDSIELTRRGQIS
jgi:Methyltransferase domain